MADIWTMSPVQVDPPIARHASPTSRHDGRRAAASSRKRNALLGERQQRQPDDDTKGPPSAGMTRQLPACVLAVACDVEWLVRLRVERDS